MKRVLIVGTGLIGASIGLAMREAGFKGQIDGFDENLSELESALGSKAIDEFAFGMEPTLEIARRADVIVLAVPVLAVLDWMQRLAPLLGPRQLVTDVGSTKLKISESARRLFNTETTAQFLPGHPMAGKESGGASLAEASLFKDAMWLFTPVLAGASPIESWSGANGWRSYAPDEGYGCARGMMCCVRG